MIPENDSVDLLNQLIETLNLTDPYPTYLSILII